MSVTLSLLQREKKKEKEGRVYTGESRMHSEGCKCVSPLIKEGAQVWEGERRKGNVKRTLTGWTTWSSF